MDTYAKLKEITEALEATKERLDKLEKIFGDEIERQKAEVKAAQEAQIKTQKKGSK